MPKLVTADEVPNPAVQGTLRANGGGNNDENCVACCKAVNALLGSMSLKEKFHVILNQKGQFKCPNGAGSAKKTTPPKSPPKAAALPKPKDDKVTLVIANLKQRGNATPRTLKTLTSTIASLFPKGVSVSEITEMVEQLQSTGKVTVTENKVTYAL
jgi:hypothetical protein